MPWLVAYHNLEPYVMCIGISYVHIMMSHDHVVFSFDHLVSLFEKEHIRWLEFICNIVYIWTFSFLLVKRDFISLKVNSVIKSREKKKTKLFGWCMRPDHTYWDPRHITLHLRSHVICLGFQLVSSGLPYHWNICFSLMTC